MQSTLVQLFNESVSNFLLLSKTKQLNDAQLKKLFNIKPGELNIILARMVELLKDDHPGKTKRDVIIDILKVVSRSPVAKTFIGIGLKDNYVLYKGFPIRKGDSLDHLPEPNNEVEVSPKDTFINWTTDASKAREMATLFDPSKGTPIGGLVVKITVDPSKLFLDVNAIITAVKKTINIIQNYNLAATPGKSLSKSNTDYLATEAPLYHDTYEIVTPNKYNKVIVEDTWYWKENNGSKNIEWKSSDKKDPTELDENDSCPSCSQFMMESKSFNESIIDYVRKSANFLSGKTSQQLKNNSIELIDNLIEKYDIEEQIYDLLGLLQKYTLEMRHKTHELDIQSFKNEGIVQDLKRLKNKINNTSDSIVDIKSLNEAAHPADIYNVLKQIKSKLNNWYYSQNKTLHSQTNLIKQELEKYKQQSELPSYKKLEALLKDAQYYENYLKSIKDYIQNAPNETEPLTNLITQLFNQPYIVIPNINNIIKSDIHVDDEFSKQLKNSNEIIDNTQEEEQMATAPTEQITKPTDIKETPTKPGKVEPRKDVSTNIKNFLNLDVKPLWDSVKDPNIKKDLISQVTQFIQTQKKVAAEYAIKLLQAQGIKATLKEQLSTTDMMVLVPSLRKAYELMNDQNKQKFDAWIKKDFHKVLEDGVSKIVQDKLEPKVDNIETVDQAKETPKPQTPESKTEPTDAPKVPPTETKKPKQDKPKKDKTKTPPVQTQPETTVNTNTKPTTPSSVPEPTSKPKVKKVAGKIHVTKPVQQQPKTTGQTMTKSSKPKTATVTPTTVATLTNNKGIKAEIKKEESGKYTLVYTEGNQTKTVSGLTDEQMGSYVQKISQKGVDISPWNQYLIQSRQPK
jgi:hypothetical protein